MCPLPDAASRLGNQHATENARAFSTTLWTTVLTTSSEDQAAASHALERLCQIYWRPVYSFVRLRGARPHDAEDLTQGFFAYLLEKETFKKANREKGKFRTFLLTALVNFLSDQRDREGRLKRGGHCRIIPLSDVEENCLPDTADSLSPEKLFDRRWARAVIEQATLLLKREFTAAGKLNVFDALHLFLAQEMTALKCSEMAMTLQMNDGAIKVALHRLRRRFGELLRDEIAQTVLSRAEIDEEIRHLFAAMSI